MGTVCGGAAATIEQSANMPSAPLKKEIVTQAKVETQPDRLVEDTPTPREPEWAMLDLDEVVECTLIHSCPLKRFKDKDEVHVPKKEEPDSPRERLESYYDEEDPDKWLCNSADPDHGLKNGCLSGLNDFGYHDGVAAYTCPDKENCDFDVCIKCLRWFIHCQKNNIEPGLANSEPAE